MRKEVRCRYLAKSKLIRCNFNNGVFHYVNLKGAIIKKTDFKNASFYGVDFLGTTFNNCNFIGAKFKDTIFVACKINKCNFKGAIFNNSIFVNTNLECIESKLVEGNKVEIFRQYPKVELQHDLIIAIEELKSNIHFMKTKVLHLSNNRYNYVNIMLLLRIFKQDELEKVLIIAKEKIKIDIVSYGHMEKELKKLWENDIIIDVPLHAIERL